MPDRSCVLSANHTAGVDCAWHEEAELSERAFEDDEVRESRKMKDPNTYAGSAKNPFHSEFTNRDSHNGILFVREQKSIG